VATYDRGLLARVRLPYALPVEMETNRGPLSRL